MSFWGVYSWLLLKHGFNIKLPSFGKKKKKKRKLNRKGEIRRQGGLCRHLREISNGSRGFQGGLENWFQREACCYFSPPACDREQAELRQKRSGLCEALPIKPMAVR